MKTRLIAAILAVVSVQAQGAESFNPQANIYFGTINTQSTPLEMSRWCIDNGVQNLKQRDWEHQANGRSTFSCTVEDGDGHEPADVTFTYHFVRMSKSAVRLERVTTSLGRTLTEREVLNGPFPLGK